MPPQEPASLSANTSHATSSASRRYDVDWLRTFALGLLIVYHIGIAFQPWGALINFITNRQPIEEIWPVMAMMNVWRIPLLFLISGMGVFFAMQRRGWITLLKDRTARIMLPFVFGFFLICPIHVYLAAKWFGMPAKYTPNMGHLWFLVNIFVYVLVLLPVFVFLKSWRGQAILDWVSRGLRHPWLLLLAAVPLAAEAWIMDPNIFSVYYNSKHGALMGLICFFSGFFLVSLGEAFWNAVQKLRWFCLGSAFVLYLIRVIVWDVGGINPVTAVESTCWMLGLIGLGSRYLNRPSGTLTYLSAAVYPVYIVHMPVQYAISYFLIPLDIAAPLKLIILTVTTFAGCFALYEILRRLKWIRPLFGMKLNGAKKPAAVAGPVTIGEVGTPT